MSEKTAARASPTRAGRAAPFEIEDVGGRVVGVRVGQLESFVALTPRF
jgi:hypothetical protein